MDTSKFIQRHLPWQADIHKILNVIKRKVLKGTHVPITIKEIQAGYLNSPFSKDLYRYLTQNIMPSKSHARHKEETLAESFILLHSLLYKLITVPNKEKALLAIPENCIEKIIEFCVDFSFCCNICRSWFSLEQNCWFIEDKLSSTAVDFIRSEGIAERQQLIWGKASSLSMPRT